MKTTLHFSALRAFEAVVRLQGFARAAEELGVTQSAVSQHVKSLEEGLGTALVIRNPGRAKPSEEGRKLAKAIVTGFGKVEAACAEIREAARPNPVINLSCFPGFAYLWLIPRLLNFEQRVPQFQISVATSAAPVDLVPDNAIAAIAYGAKRMPGLEMEVLFSERLFPVCAPGLLRENPINAIGDLANHTMLIDDLNPAEGMAPTWQYWAKSLKTEMPPAARALKFTQSNMVVQAAIQGLGVALGREPLVTDALSDGRLVRPLKGSVMSQCAYSLVYPRSVAKSEKFQALRDWLMAETLHQPSLQEPSLQEP